ncbi:MAG TPA: DUF4091 domain-containing protein [bacterium]|nr:DUF4091 domain-containing protein [bacterium]HPN44270.1 DUF4091 domain-containing protein [bacterium]
MFIKRVHSSIILFIAISSICPARPQNPALSDYSNRDNWQLIAGEGSWQKDPQSGEMCLTVTGGAGMSESNYWILKYPFQPRSIYKLTCQARKSPGASGGRILIGSNIVNKDCDAEYEWTSFEFYFTTPNDVGSSYLRFGQWQVTGTIWFRNVQLTPVQPIYKTTAGIELGDGESIIDNVYRVLLSYKSLATNSSRCLYSSQCYFNTNRWDFRLGSYIIYQHRLGDPGVEQVSGRVNLNVLYYTSGSLTIEASRDGERWTAVGSTDKAGNVSCAIPQNLYPTENIYIRLSGSGLNPRLQIHSYAYEAVLSGSIPDMTGRTNFADIIASPQKFAVQFTSPDKSGAIEPALTITNPISKSRTFIIKDDNGRTLAKVNARAGQILNVQVPVDAKGFIHISPQDEQTDVFTAQIKQGLSPLDAADYGYLMHADNSAAVWWTDGVRKISKTRPAPVARDKTITFNCARNEYEPMQLVIKAGMDMQQITARVSAITHSSGYKLPADAANLCLVDYVFIQNPTDILGSNDWWPDPLPPLKTPFAIKKGENQPLWLVIYVPKNAPAGDYTGAINLACGTWRFQAPLHLHVWNFTLPEETHLQTAFGFQASAVKQYHHFSNADNLTVILDKYFKNFAQHRISPYDPFVLGDMAVRFDPATLSARVDFSKFDVQGYKYLDQMGFNSFRLNLRGLGRGSFHAQQPGQIDRFAAGTPEYEKMITSYLAQVQDHLQEKGWLDKAYIYLFDEPEPKDYEFIRETNTLIQKAAPRLTRMLTEQPEPDLYGYVDLWCPKTDNYNHTLAEQAHARGEKIWWYICTSPQDPFCTLFIDHYAVELRTWIWQSWKYGLDGILVWQTNYWTSETAFPTQPQNPYNDPMSYVRGGSLKPGEIAYWGNGDGRFIYPPKSVFTGKQKCLEGPVNSLRWEILREGLEDYEYFWLLQDLIENKAASGINPQLLQQARQLLQVPAEVTTSLTGFTKTPEPILAHRAKLAAMIEKLQNENP